MRRHLLTILVVGVLAGCSSPDAVIPKETSTSSAAPSVSTTALDAQEREVLVSFLEQQSSSTVETSDSDVPGSAPQQSAPRKLEGAESSGEKNTVSNSTQKAPGDSPTASESAVRAPADVVADLTVASSLSTVSDALSERSIGSITERELSTALGPDILSEVVSKINNPDAVVSEQASHVSASLVPTPPSASPDDALPQDLIREGLHYTVTSQDIIVVEPSSPYYVAGRTRVVNVTVVARENKEKTSRFATVENFVMEYNGSTWVIVDSYSGQ